MQISFLKLGISQSQISNIITWLHTHQLTWFFFSVPYDLLYQFRLHLGKQVFQLCVPFAGSHHIYIVGRNHTYTNSRRIGENKLIPNICHHSWAFSHKLTSNGENWLPDRIFANISLFRKFGSAENVFGA